MQTKRPLSPDLRANITRLKQMFGSSTDLYTKPVRVLGVDCCLCMFEGLSTLERLWVVMLAMLTESNYRPKSGDDLFQYIQHKTDLPLENTPVEDFDALLCFPPRTCSSVQCRSLQARETSVVPGRALRIFCGST